MSSPTELAIKAALGVAREVAEGTLAPAVLDAEVVEQCRGLVGQVIGPGDALWGLQCEVARGVLAAGGVPADELAEWLAVQRQGENAPCGARNGVPTNEQVAAEQRKANAPESTGDGQ
ncbi:Uncharacterised protein [Mycolicibacterium vanbaalenii]|uniref:Flagellar hook-length control protein n=1 Tax=Mycolicibacterium vanbaalenii TaxID=110539 RepID=A0A5S9RAC0_MYCVN|nr:flagellar hook-length control protein [Mycolicibacterium vanbaalenii]CAA0136338.1 Uncharacterised protein [Mycolicibacterium vanbaalenii]